MFWEYRGRHNFDQRSLSGEAREKKYKKMTLISTVEALKLYQTEDPLNMGSTSKYFNSPMSEVRPIGKVGSGLRNSLVFLNPSKAPLSYINC